MKRRFKSYECDRMIDANVHFSLVNLGGSDELLWDAQKNHMASVLERVLKTNEGMRLTRKHHEDPDKI